MSIFHFSVHQADGGDSSDAAAASTEAHANAAALGISTLSLLALVLEYGAPLVLGFLSKLIAARHQAPSTPSLPPPGSLVKPRWDPPSV